MQNGNSDNKHVAIPRSNGVSRANSVYGRRPDQFEPGQAAPNALWEYLAVAKRRKLILFLSTLVGVIAGFVALLFQPPLYMAQMTLELQGFNEGFMHMGEVDPQAGTGNYSSSATNINTEIKIIQSKSVEMPVIERLARETTPMVHPPRDWVDRLRLRIHRGPVDPLQEMRVGIGGAARTLAAKPVTGTRIIAVSCESTVPEIAASFVNSIGQEFIAKNSQARTATTQKTAQWLDLTVEETKVKLEEAQAHLEEFERKSPLVFQGPGEQETLSNQKLASLTSELAASQGDRISRQAKYDAIKKGDPTSIPDVVDNSRIREDRLKLEQLEDNRAQLLLKFTEANAKVYEIDKQINATRNQIKQQTDAVLQRIKDEYDASLNRERYLKNEYTIVAKAVTGQSEMASQHSLLRREVDIYKATLNSMLAEVNQAAVLSALPADNIRLIDSASPPGVPYKPDMTSFLMSGGFVGFGLAFVLVQLKERLHKRKTTMTFSAPGYAATVLSVPELGVIPSADYDADKARRNGRRHGRRGYPGQVVPKNLAVPGGFGMGLSAVSQYGAATLLAESFRLTVTSLMLMGRLDKRLRVIVVTSPGPGEGKTTVSSNIAVGLAEAGQKVLIVDMDLRRPRLHTVFDLPNDRGLSDLIRSKTPLQITEMDTPIIQTKVPGISILTSGKVETGAISEILHSPRLPVLLRQLREAFDTVIVDTPPVLQFSESRLVASLADGVILVLRSGMTDKSRAVMARDQLAMDGIEVIGAILNDWDPDTAESSKYDSYYSAYMQYQKEDAK